MLRFVVYFFLISILLIGFGFSFLNNFEKQKEQILTKYQLETKTTSLFIQENLKKYHKKRMQVKNAKQRISVSLKWVVVF